MTRDDIIRMAREAEASFETAESMFKFAALVAAAERERLTAAAFAAAEKAIDAAIAAEREACAKVCDDLVLDQYSASGCAAAIRARGQQ
jgi:hypothetical protein